MAFAEDSPLMEQHGPMALLVALPTGDLSSHAHLDTVSHSVPVRPSGSARPAQDSSAGFLVIAGALCPAAREHRQPER